MKIDLYWHAGSANHGCEAIVRGTQNILNGYELQLFSRAPHEDAKFISDLRICTFHSENEISRLSLKHLKCFVKYRLGNKDTYLEEKYKPTINSKTPLALSIGGDIYCSEGGPKLQAYINSEKHKRNQKTILWGCSIEPDVVKRPEVIKDLRLYDAIVARESITYDALKANGVEKNTFLVPDPAFTLQTAEVDLDGNKEYIAINASPLVEKFENRPGLLYENYCALVEYIINCTQYNVLLIPHVVWDISNDLDFLEKLYKKYQATGRVTLVDDSNSMILKGIISKCKMAVVARTHASIAAYSSCVPTLVIGYSVKSKGLAKDLFGDHVLYVIDSKNIKNTGEILERFRWMEKNCENIRMHLAEKMPQYIKESYKAKEIVEDLIDE